MLLSLFCSIVLGGLVTAGSVSHIARQGTVACIPVSGMNGTLVITSFPGAPTTLPANGVPLAIVNNNLQQDNDSLHQQFVFESCTSNYMGLYNTIEGSLSIYYGHLTLQSDATQCVMSGAQATSVQEQNIFAGDCGFTDDTSQTALFWQLTLDIADPTLPAPLMVVAKPASDTDNTNYVIDWFTDLAWRYYGFGPTPTYYQIKLLPA